MGTENLDEERDASELFPHTRVCVDRMRHANVAHGYNNISCSCKAKQRRKAFLHIIRRVKTQSYTDAYAKIRHQAKLQAGQAKTAAEREAFQAVATWAEMLELSHLNE